MMRIADEKLAATSSSTITETVLRYYIHSLIPPLKITGDLALVTTHVPDFIKIEFSGYNLRLPLCSSLQRLLFFMGMLCNAPELPFSYSLLISQSSLVFGYLYAGIDLIQVTKSSVD